MTEKNYLYLKLLSTNLRRQLGLPEADAEQIRSMLAADIPQPLVLTNRAGTVWIDPFYAAFYTKGTFRYVYLSKQHISEEVTAARLSPNYTIPQFVREQFAAALRFMKKSGCDVWIEKQDYSSLIVH